MRAWWDGVMSIVSYWNWLLRAVVDGNCRLCFVDGLSVLYVGSPSGFGMWAGAAGGVVGGECAWRIGRDG